jgi:hypothetical protein
MLSHETLAAIGVVRDRTRQHVSIALSDLDSLTIALAAGSVESESLVEYMHDGSVRTDVLSAMSHLALSDSDFVNLYGRNGPSVGHAESAGTNHPRIAEYEACPEARELRVMLEEALLTTLCEDVQGKLWRSSATTRLAALVALCRTSDAQGCLSSIVGGMVATDARRVDDLKTRIEDGGIDVMLVSQGLRALASSTVSS